MLSRRRFILGSSLAVASLAVTGLAGCASSDKTVASDAGAAPSSMAQPESRALMGSPDPCTARIGLIMGPPSMGLSQLITAANEGVTENSFEFTVNGVDYIGLSAAFNEGDYDICTLPSNIGPILYNNHDLQNEYEIISINNLGVLYVMTTDPSISGMSDHR